MSARWREETDDQERLRDPDESLTEAPDTEDVGPVDAPRGSRGGGPGAPRTAFRRSPLYGKDRGNQPLPGKDRDRKRR